jgi:deazaflavin-dependent oxidoreductase (nitroreductase family)
MLVLVHTGRRTGRSYRTPLTYARVGTDLYCLVGFGAGSDWYRNVLATPAVEVWLPTGRWVGTTEDSSDASDRIRIMREVLIAGGSRPGCSGCTRRG